MSREMFPTVTEAVHASFTDEQWVSTLTVSKERLGIHPLRVFTRMEWAALTAALEERGVIVPDQKEGQ